MKLFLAFLYIVAFICVYVVAYPIDQDDQATRQQRQAGGGDHHDVVDFGAHTGDHGAFGWYADFPVYAHDD